MVFDPFLGLLLKNIYEVTNDKKYLEVMEKIIGYWWRIIRNMIWEAFCVT